MPEKIGGIQERIIKLKVYMTTKKILAIAIAACLCLTSAPGQGGFNLEPGPFQKVERSPFIVVGHVKEVGQTVTVVVSQKIRGEEEISDVQLPGQPRDIEDRIIRYTVGESLILYLKKDGSRFDLIQGGYGVQIASESNINAVKDGVALLAAPKNEIAGLLKQMLEGTDSHKHMAIDYLLTQKTDLMSDDEKSLIVTCTIPLLESDDFSIRRDADRILGRFKAKAALQPLLARLTDRHNAVVQEASSSLAFITGITGIQFPSSIQDSEKVEFQKKWKQLIESKKD